MTSTDVPLSKAAFALLVECTQTADKIPLHSQWVSLKAATHQTDTKEQPTVVSPASLTNSRTGTHRKDFSRRPSSTYPLRMRESQ